MSVNLYIILVIATLLIQFSCIVMGIRAAMRSDIKFGWGVIVFILIVIAIIHLSDLISIEQLKKIELSGTPLFEITSLIGSITLLAILIFLETTVQIQKLQVEHERIPKVEPPRVEPVIRPEPIVKKVEDKSTIVVAEKEKEITNLKKELEKVSAQKDKLVSIISHDLRTPLNSVFGYCQILKDGQFKGRKEVRQFAENIFDLSKQQLSALNKILDWTRVESKDLQLNPTDFEISSTINFVAKSFSKIAEAKKLNIVVSSDYHGLVYGDEFMIIEVLKNLLENAIKFSNPNSTIEIISHYHPKVNKLIVLVCDSGIGIHKDVLINILSTANKFTARGTAGEKGIGLGLLICKAILDKHEEKIWIASEEGKWTRVYFSLKPSKPAPT